MASTTEPSAEDATTEATDGHSLSAPRAAFAGLAAATFAIGLAELIAGASNQLVGPLTGVGEAFIPLVPNWLKDIAIELFGESDKIALIAGMVVTIAIVAAAMGMLARTQPVAAASGAALLGLAGWVAAWVSERSPVAGLATLTAAVVAPAALLWLVRQPAAGAAGVAHGGAEDRADDSEAVAAGTDGVSRRTVLSTSATLFGAGAVLAGAGRFVNARVRAGVLRGVQALPGIRNPLAPIPQDVTFDVPGLTPFITPMEEFYRVDTALEPPVVDVANWELRIHGRVDQELSFTYADLLDMDLIERDITLTCVSNPIGGDLLGNARWQGVLLRDLLAPAGIDPSADQLVGRSVDNYTCGFPVDKIMDRDAMLVVGMNGERLPVDRGFPARLLVPGLFGYVSATKWLEEIELTTFADFEQYWVERDWDEQAPILTQCRIETPTVSGGVSAGEVTFAGVAWAQTRGIEKVEIRVGGLNDDPEWVETELAAEHELDTWRHWKYTTTIPEGFVRVTVRATDKTGTLQSQDRTEVFPRGATGWPSLVYNVQA